MLAVSVNTAYLKSVMAYFLWFWRIISPFIIIAAIIYFAFGEWGVGIFIAGGITGILGIIIGIVGWDYNVPPRWFWIKSLSELAGSRVLSAIAYGIQFACLPAGIMGIVLIISELL